MPASGELTRTALIGQLDWFYNLYRNAPFLMGGAFPSFSNKVLADAGKESGYRFLNYSNGDIFKLTLEYAEKAQPAVIQIITWNDYGEGTIIEPTIERGYAELEVLQDFRKKYDGSFAFSKADLRAPIEFYKQLAGNTAGTRKQTMEQARDAIFSGNAAAFRQYAIEAGIQYDLSVRPALRKTVAAASSEGGSVKTNKNWANAGESVTVTVVPAENYHFDTLLVKGAGGEGSEIAASGSENTYTFIMPDYAVTVSAVFIRDPGTPEKKPEVPGEEPAPPSKDPEVPDNNPEKPDSGKNGGSGCDGFTPGRRSSLRCIRCSANIGDKKGCYETVC
jgi:hypothetical protein